MEIYEIKKLMPFFVAGTLDDKERILVENALKESQELRNEFEFWQKAQYTVEQHSQFYQAGHLTPEQIIIAAEGVIRGGSKGSSVIEIHLQACKQCRQDVEMIKSSYPITEIERIEIPQDEKIIMRHEKDLQSRNFGKFRFADVLAAAAVLLIIMTFFFTNFDKREIPLNPPVHYANLILSYNPSTRGDASTEIPILALDSNTTRINIVVYVPHSDIDSLRYSVAISLPTGTGSTISNDLLPLRFDGTLDTIRFEVGREFFKTVPAKYRLVLSEVLPQSKSYLTSESYVYDFKVQ